MDTSLLDTHLRRSRMMVGLDTVDQDDLLACFTVRSFTAGERLVVAGEGGGTIGVILTGAAEVRAREGEQHLALARLGPGAIFGEISFFDRGEPPVADVVGLHAGVAAMLPYGAYEELCALAHPAAAALETAVLGLLSERIQTTNKALEVLLEEAHKGGLWAALTRFFLGGRG